MLLLLPQRVYGLVLNYAHGEVYIQSDTFRVTKLWNTIWAELVACMVQPGDMYSLVLVFLEYVRGRDHVDVEAHVGR